MSLVSSLAIDGCAKEKETWRQNDRQQVYTRERHIREDNQFSLFCANYNINWLLFAVRLTETPLERSATVFYL